jgi:ribonucleoside-triphosphate reductase
MDLASELASEITIFGKYARYIPELKRRETWEEIVDRYEAMMVKKYTPHFVDSSTNDLYLQIKEACNAVRNKEVLPSMRGLQFAGPAIERNNSRIYNCAFVSAVDPSFFRECMFLLLGGTGVGYSVQERHIRQLPAITKPGKARKYLVGDSIEGWADAVKVLCRAFFKGTFFPKFDFSDVRPKGERLITAGGKAPGPGPLRICLDKILGLLETKPVGTKLTSVEVSDIACFIADAVLAGGIRRAAMICLFDIDDVAMLAYKRGEWWETRPERARVNVSAVAFREDVVQSNVHVAGVNFNNYHIARATTEEQFKKFWKATEESRSGEPGIYWTNHPDWGTNPCCEIALRHKQFCNLTTINFSTVKSQEDFNRRSRVAAILGTLQAGFVDMHYLGHEWEENCREESLLGISLTGIADNGSYRDFNFEEAAKVAKETNEEVAKAIGINKAARITCIKPEGTASLVVGSASGVHGRHAPYYIRRTRHNASEPLIAYLAKTNPALVVENKSEPGGLILELPQRSPEGSITRDETALETLERLKFFRENWIEHGHNSGLNTHNVSCTVSIRDDVRYVNKTRSVGLTEFSPEMKTEWQVVGEWMWENRAFYNGIAVLPYDGGTYTQAPFEDCTEEVYNEMMKNIQGIDLTQIVEEDDMTNQAGELACAGGKCEI